MSDTRNILVIVAHPEPTSFNHALAHAAAGALRTAGHEVTISDLAADGFRPDVGPHDVLLRRDNGRFHVQAEQAHAALHQHYAEDIARQQALVAAADNIILQFPIWWGGPPALLKGWIDRVLSYGFGYVDGRRFGTGVFKGRRALISVTTGGTPERFSDDGVYGPIDPLLMPVRKLALEYMGFEVEDLCVAYAVARVNEAERQRYLDAIADAALKMAARPVQRNDDHRTALSEVADRGWASKT